MSSVTVSSLSQLASKMTVDTKTVHVESNIFGCIPAVQKYVKNVDGTFKRDFKGGCALTSFLRRLTSCGVGESIRTYTATTINKYYKQVATHTSAASIASTATTPLLNSSDDSSSADLQTQFMEEQRKAIAFFNRQHQENKQKQPDVLPENATTERSSHPVQPDLVAPVSGGQQVPHRDALTLTDNISRQIDEAIEAMMKGGEPSIPSRQTHAPRSGRIPSKLPKLNLSLCRRAPNGDPIVDPNAYVVVPGRLGRQAFATSKDGFYVLKTDIHGLAEDPHEAFKAWSKCC